MIGGLENDVRRLAADEDVDIANINSPNQIVISGELANVETAVGVAKEYDIGRAMMLNVAGAYHSRLMPNRINTASAIRPRVIVLFRKTQKSPVTCR